MNGIKAAERALSRERALRLLDETSPDLPWAGARMLGIDIMKLRPGKRLTVRYTLAMRGEGPSERVLFGKAYGGHGGERVAALLRAIEASPPDGEQARLRLPRCLGYNVRRRFLLLDTVKGEALANLLERPDAGARLALFGCALAGFHSLGGQLAGPLPIGRPPVAGSTAGARMAIRSHAASDEAGVVSLAQSVFQSSPLAPELGEEYGALAWRVRSLLLEGGRQSMPVSLLHRDLYPDQVLAGKEDFGLVDLDEAAYGEAELDVGNFSAHLLLRDMQGRAAVGPGRGQAAAVRVGYEREAHLDDRRVSVYLAAALVRLASLERISRSKVSVLAWPALARALLGEAERALAGVGP